MTEKRFTVHIKWFNYEKTEGEIELFDNGQPLLMSDCVEDVQMVKDLLNELYEENNELNTFKQKTLDLIDQKLEENPYLTLTEKWNPNCNNYESCRKNHEKNVAYGSKHMLLKELKNELKKDD